MSETREIAPFAEDGSARDERAGGDGDDRALRVIGWRERVDFPEWDVRGVLAKIDTGACVSALHVTDIERLEGDRVAFHVALDRKMSQLSERIVASLRRETKIRSSNGVVQHRYIVCVTMDVGGVRQPIEVSLVCRKSMRCRMLLGREGLSGAFLVDPERDYLLTTRPEKPPRKPRKTSTRRSGAAGGSRREESKKRASGSTRTNTGAGSSRGSSPGGATMDAETGKRSAP